MSTADAVHKAILQLRETYPIRLAEHRAQNGKALLAAIAQVHDGRLLEPAYLGTALAHRFRCGKGHRFAAFPHSLFRGGWCGACSADSRKLGLSRAHEVAHTKGGVCLSKRYTGVKDKLRWQCHLGHHWMAPLDTVGRGAWCHACAHQLGPDEMLILVRAAARARGGRLLSPRYVNGRTKLDFRCRAGHEWSAAPSHVLSGTWCPRCAGHGTPAEQLERLRRFAEQQGGQLLSDQYVSSATKVRLRCSLGHEWSAVPSSLFQGHWCGRCAHLRRRTYEHRKSPVRRMLNR